jgi:hypothetical protein
MSIINLVQQLYSLYNTNEYQATCINIKKDI